MRLSIPAAVVLGLAACVEAPGETFLQIGTATYRLPESHIRSLTTKPHQFVRIDPPNRDFDLVYDSRTERQRDDRGWPVIFSINEKTGSDVRRYRGDDFEVLCLRAVSPEGGCGMVLRLNGAQWSVLFPDSKLQAAPLIRQEAIAALNGYSS